jgi:NOL1/NOP2/fmu family ribosome biogenesis protein
MPETALRLGVDGQWEAEMWRLIEAQFGVASLPGYRLLRSGRYRIRIISEAAYQLTCLTPGFELAGLYLGEFGIGGIRLSLDGAQLIGPHATRQVVSLTSAQAEAWLRGESIDVEDRRSGYVVVRHQSDILGCGNLSRGRLHNFLPKDRRPQKQ